MPKSVNAAANPERIDGMRGDRPLRLADRHRPQDLERVAAQAEPGGLPLATRLIDAGLVSELEALKALSAQRGGV